MITIQIRNEFEALMAMADEGSFEQFKRKNLAVVGSRMLKNAGYVGIWLAYLKPIKIITGGAKGADTFAEEYAKKHDIPCDVHYPDLIRWPYHRFKGKAYLERNGTIATACDAMLAFLPVDGESRGTENSIKQAKSLGKEIIISYF